MCKTHVVGKRFRDGYFVSHRNSMLALARVFRAVNFKVSSTQVLHANSPQGIEQELFTVIIGE